MDQTDAAVKRGDKASEPQTNRVGPRKGIPRYRDYSGPAVFLAGFRPFFLFAGLWAVAGLFLSMTMFMGYLEAPFGLSPGDWHFHEMLFGFVTASVAGFLLTAVPNWTGSMPLQGPGLMVLFGLWLLGRIGMSGILPLTLHWAAMLDLSFSLVLAIVILREVLTGKNWRNLPVVAVVVLLFLANGIFHGAVLEYWDLLAQAKRLAILVVTVLITLIGGRIIPSFTRNWLVKRGETRLPSTFGTYDKVNILATLIALASWVVSPFSAVSGLLLVAASLLNYVRLARWQPFATVAEPLLWVLHVGYFWIPTGLALTALAAFLGSPYDVAALHALTMGAMGTMILAVMGRVAKGHTGRELTAGPLLTIAYVILNLSVFARLAAVFCPDFYDALLHPAALGWTVSFALFLVSCGAYLVTRRPKAES